MLENDTWEAMKALLRSRMTSDAFTNWVAPTQMIESRGGKLRVGVPDEVTRLWLEGEYAPKIAQAMRELTPPVMELQFEIFQPQPAASLAPRLHLDGFRAAPEGASEPVFHSNLHLNPRFRFEEFIVGSCNQFAHAAARAVAAAPSKHYNPLFIYGGSGMGKSHLLHAIAHRVLEQYPGMRVVLTTAERFVNEMVQCIRKDRMSSFHAHYRTADVLLIDDVHSIAGKERTQEEFFHTFNELYEHQKQIVLTSDQMPKNTHGLVDRLRSRFEWGLMVDVQPPDLETKRAILDKKAEQEGIALPDDVRIFVATKTRSNVRELEGAWTKLVAYSSVTNAPMTMAMAQQVLKTVLPSQERRITIDMVVRAVAEKYSLQPAQLKQKTNAHEISRPRQVAMYIAKELTSASLPEIGRAFGGKHHTTVLHAIRKIEELRQQDPDLNRLIQSIIDSFQ